ncbi:fibritin neck whiskers protein [Yersinia phage vB_YenM_P8]
MEYVFKLYYQNSLLRTKMINKLSLKELPYSIGIPDEGQQRIRWIQNGDCMTAASTKYGHDGNLNAAAVGVQTNVDTLDDNSNASKEKINEIIDNVNNIQEALNITTNTEVVKQIEKNRTDILDLDERQFNTELLSSETSEDLKKLKEDVGVYDPLTDSYYRTVRNDLVWIKNELGQYVDQDINGLQVIGNPSKGMKRRIIDNSSAIVAHGVRIKTLEDNYHDSDVGSLNIKVIKIREELGESTLATGKPTVFVRLNTLDDKVVEIDEDIVNIQEAIGFGNGLAITTRVENLGGRVSVNETDIADIKPRLAKVEADIGTALEPLTINGRISALRSDVNGLQVVVGQDSSSGLRGTTAWLSQRIGTEQSPEPNTITYKLNATTTLANETASGLQDVQAEIGTNNTGMKGSILTLTSQMNGTNPNGATVAERGVLPVVINLDMLMASKLNDAPLDNKLYGRKQGNWTEIIDTKTEIDAIKLDTAKIAPLTTRVTTLEGTVTPLPGRLDAAEAKITTLEGKVSALETELAKRPPVAPAADGLPYVLVDNAWVLLSTFVTVGP